MVETIMYLGIGFLAASLLGLVIVPLVHNRAVRLTRRRLEATTPLSIAEIQADKDQLRAEFAISIRRLELSVEQLKARSTGQLSELGKQAEAITLLKNELAEKAATILRQETRERALMEQIRTTEQERDAKAAALHETELALAEKVAALAKATTGLDERTLTTDAQRVEITALRTQVDALKVQLEHRGKDLKGSEDRLVRDRSEADAASRVLADERGRAGNLGNRAEVASTDGRHREPAEAVLADNIRLQALLEQMSAERARLERDLAAMKREAEAARASERGENSLLRERINEIAAEVARITMTLEGPNSPIETILAAEDRGATNGSGQGREEQRSNLADRIRALQRKASRLSPLS
ncbi:MAG: hypothetical protein J2O44_07515 [Porphyrobacter sp.]|nr:hypothetical protein [Porphyrobacter sp.]